MIRIWDTLWDTLGHPKRDTIGVAPSLRGDTLVRGLFGMPPDPIPIMFLHERHVRLEPLQNILPFPATPSSLPLPEEDRCDVRREPVKERE